MLKTRGDVLELLERQDLDWGDEEDAEALLDLLLGRFSPAEVGSFLMFYNYELRGTPLDLLSQGRSRQVFIHARRMVA